MFYKTVATIVLLGSIITAEGNSDRILGGEDVSITNHPYQVSLQINEQHFCGGSIYSNQIIITAAHCFMSFGAADVEYLSVLLGTSKLATGGIRIPFESFSRHQYYNTEIKSYDLALVKMKSPVTFSKSIQPIALSKRTPESGSQVFVTGWGVLNNTDSKASPKLQGAQLDFIPRAACGSPPNAYSSDSISATMICAAADQKGSCRGDSGGPLIDVYTKTLLGVVSWGSTCATAGYPGVYTNVVVLANWIKKSAETLSKP